MWRIAARIVSVTTINLPTRLNIRFLRTMGDTPQALLDFLAKGTNCLQILNPTLRWIGNKCWSMNASRKMRSYVLRWYTPESVPPEWVLRVASAWRSNEVSTLLRGKTCKCRQGDVYVDTRTDRDAVQRIGKLRIHGSGVR